jgi:hypothetical protein
MLEASLSSGNLNAIKKGAVALALVASATSVYALFQNHEIKLVVFSFAALAAAPVPMLLWTIRAMSALPVGGDKIIAQLKRGSRLRLGLGMFLLCASWFLAGALLFLAGYLFPQWQFTWVRHGPAEAMIIGAGLSAASVYLLFHFLAGAAKRD